MALHEKKLPFKTHFVNIAKSEQYQPWFLEMNPRGEVPVLKDGVKIIPDSSRIIDYLEDNFSNGMQYCMILLCHLICTFVIVLAIIFKCRQASISHCIT